MKKKNPLIFFSIYPWSNTKNICATPNSTSGFSLEFSIVIHNTESSLSSNRWAFRTKKKNQHFFFYFFSRLLSWALVFWCLFIFCNALVFVSKRMMVGKIFFKTKQKKKIYLLSENVMIVYSKREWERIFPIFFFVGLK